MKGKAQFDGRAQGRALRGLLRYDRHRLWTRTGKTLEDIAGQLDMSLSTLQRYLSGQAPLGSDQFDAFAAAFDVDRDALVRMCLLTPRTEDAPMPLVITLDEVAIRRRLERGGVPEDEIREVLSEIRARDLTDDMLDAIVEVVIADVCAYPRRNPRRASR